MQTVTVRFGPKIAKFLELHFPNQFNVERTGDEPEFRIEMETMKEFSLLSQALGGNDNENGCKIHLGNFLVVSAGKDTVDLVFPHQFDYRKVEGTWRELRYLEQWP